MGISDELRATVCKLEGYIHISAISNELHALADRIGAEMVELPRDRDGVPIHVGDTVYDGDMSECTVTSLYLRDGKEGPSWMVHVDVHGRRVTANHTARELSHERPDSLERIAEELEAWSEDNRVSGDANIFSRAAYIAQRIRRLASEGASGDGE